MITEEDWKAWEKKFPQKYIDVMKKKCRSFNCGNYKMKTGKFCPSCLVGKSEPLTPIDMVIVRKMIGISVCEHEEEILKRFDKNG